MIRGVDDGHGRERTGFYSNRPNDDLCVRSLCEGIDGRANNMGGAWSRVSKVK